MKSNDWVIHEGLCWWWWWWRRRRRQQRWQCSALDFVTQTLPSFCSKRCDCWAIARFISSVTCCWTKRDSIGPLAQLPWLLGSDCNLTPWRLDDVIKFRLSHFIINFCKFWPLWISGHCPVCPSLCFCRSSGQGPMRVEWRWVWWVWSGKLPDTTDMPPVYLVSQMWQNCSKVWRLLGFCWANEFGRILKLALTQWRLGLACSCWITHDRPLLWQESTVSSSNLSWPLFAKLLLIYFEFSTQAPHKIYSAYSWDIFCSSLLTLRHKRSVKFSASCCA